MGFLGRQRLALWACGCALATTSASASTLATASLRDHRLGGTWARRRSPMTAKAVEVSAAAATATARLTFGETMLVGAISRSIAQTAMQPANVIKTLLQGRNTGGQLRHLSFRLLTRGAGAQFVLSIPHGAFNFATLEAVRAFSAGLFPGKALGPALDFLSSSVATTISSVVSTPQMVLTDRIMAGVYPSLVSGVRAISREQGLRGFYAGWLPALAQKIPSYGLTWVLFEQFKAAHGRITGRAPTAAENFGLGAAAAGATVCLMIPLDTVKTRLVTQMPTGMSAAAPAGTAVCGPAAVPYTGMVDCARRMIAEEGVGSLYRALWPRLAAVVPMVGVQFGCYETLKKVVLRRRDARAAAAARTLSPRGSGGPGAAAAGEGGSGGQDVRDFLENLALLDEELL